MSGARCGPVAFLLTGLAWLLVMAISGMALYVGIVRSTPVASTLRLVHAHGALVGGVVQMLVGAWLARRRSLGMGGATGQWGRYLTLNLGTVGMLAGFWLQQYHLVGAAGLVAIGPLLPICGDIITLARKGGLGSGWASWFSAFLAATFVAGTLMGLGYSFTLLPPQWIIHARLAHVHLLVQGFLVVAAVGLLQQLTAASLDTSLWSRKLTGATSGGVVLGVIGLLTGFGLAHVWVQLAGGALLFLTSLALGYNLLRTWLTAASRSNHADHFLVGTLFLVLGMGLGLLVAVNYLFDPRPMPFGTLHLVAYTHMVFVGMLISAVFGGVSAWLPDLLAHDRVSSHRKRLHYAGRLHGLMDRWHAPQIGALSLGTMGLAAVAALTWQYPLGAAPIQYTMWASLVLVLVSLALFAAKIGIVVGERPEQRGSAAS